MSTRPERTASVPVSWGSPRFRTRVVGAFEITDAFFPPGATLPRHTHDRSVLAIALSGAIESLLTGRVVRSRENDVWTEPAGDSHSNRVGERGAHVLVLQPDPTREELLRPCRSLLDGVHHFTHAGVAHLARCVIPELRATGKVDDLMVEGLALQLLATSLRGASLEVGSAAWLDRVLELVHERFRERLTLDTIAREAGVHAGHLARAFKARTGVTVGRYVRRLRLEWAATRLRTSDDPIGRIALQARFADQSHFTRAFRRHVGTTPGRYRRAARP